MTHKRLYSKRDWKRVRRGRPCPVCSRYNKPCAFIPDEVAICINVRSDREVAGCMPGWLHFLRPFEPARIVTPTRQVETPSPLAPIGHRDAVYSALLRLLDLSDKHKMNLHARGLSDFAITRNCYRSTAVVDSDETAERAWQIIQALDLGLVGVPGFQRRGDAWYLLRTRPGFFVPHRDEHGRIQAMQYRLDEPFGGRKYVWFSSSECSSGAPVHHAHFHLLPDADEVVVTEDALKADVIAHLAQAPVIGIAGVGTFGAGFADHLRAVAPNLRAVVVAYDMDVLYKSEVLRALESLTAQLQRARFRVRVRTWPPEWKGYDDYLLAQLQTEEVRAA